MVSNASDDLPEPLGPVMTTSRFLGKDTLTFFRLCCAALVTTRLSMFARSSTQSPGSAEGVETGPARRRPAGAARFDLSPRRRSHWKHGARAQRAGRLSA